ncbi:hypothetical protein BXZ70DRAFT_1011338 [Cristinia sonorae]|uniref:Uncharacterized protein n=1 Tax=Cristinia sonorae TaxID=1940300 RepID=A0A8K0UHN7_9AGAR|nr:hypothetical protein BXZ70DRAFT_1011338 [Cristinia sonorae]
MSANGRTTVGGHDLRQLTCNPPRTFGKIIIRTVVAYPLYLSLFNHNRVIFYPINKGFVVHKNDREQAHIVNTALENIFANLQCLPDGILTTKQMWRVQEEKLSVGVNPLALKIEGIRPHDLESAKQKRARGHKAKRLHSTAEMRRLMNQRVMGKEKWEQQWRRGERRKQLERRSRRSKSFRNPPQRKQNTLGGQTVENHIFPFGTPEGSTARDTLGVSPPSESHSHHPALSVSASPAPTNSHHSQAPSSPVLRNHLPDLPFAHPSSWRNSALSSPLSGTSEKDAPLNNYEAQFSPEPSLHPPLARSYHSPAPSTCSSQAQPHDHPPPLQTHHISARNPSDLSSSRFGSSASPLCPPPELPQSAALSVVATASRELLASPVRATLSVNTHILDSEIPAPTWNSPVIAGRKRGMSSKNQDASDHAKLSEPPANRHANENLADERDERVWDDMRSSSVDIPLERVLKNSRQGREKKKQALKDERLRAKKALKARSGKQRGRRKPPPPKRKKHTSEIDVTPTLAAGLLAIRSTSSLTNSDPIPGNITLQINMDVWQKMKQSARERRLGVVESDNEGPPPSSSVAGSDASEEEVSEKEIWERAVSVMVLDEDKEEIEEEDMDLSDRIWAMAQQVDIGGEEGNSDVEMMYLDS